MVWGDQRAQTVYDFAVGVSVFLIVIVGVLAFVPSVFGGTGASIQGEGSVTANRVAGFLVDDGFAPADQPNELENECVQAFFADTAECGFGSDNGFATDVGIGANTGLNVTVEADLDNDGTLDHLCWDNGAMLLVRAGDTGCHTTYTTGPSASRNGEFAAAKRTGQLRATRVFVVVRVW
jgi:hypothetical protein